MKKMLKKSKIILLVSQYIKLIRDQIFRQLSDFYALSNSDFVTTNPDHGHTQIINKKVIIVRFILLDVLIFWP